MQEGDQLRLRNLPDGISHAVIVRSAQGRMIELDLLGDGADCKPETPAELDSSETLYLGIIEQRQGSRLWLNVEHMIDRRVLSTIQAAWKETGPAR